MTASYSQSPGAGIARAQSYGWSVLETAALFVVLAAPPYWLGLSNLYIIVPVAVAATYVIGAPVAALLRQPANAAARIRVAVFALAQFVSGCAVAASLSILLATTWTHFAYREEMISPNGLGLGGPFEFATALTPATGHGLWDRLGLWTVVAVVLIAVAYAYPLLHMLSMERFGSPGFMPY